MATAPTLVGFIAFVRGVVQIPALVIPDDSPDLVDAFDAAMATVSVSLACAPGFHGAPTTIYTMAVYNFGADFLINYASDQPDRTAMLDIRKAFNINLFAPGVTASSADGGTSQSRLNPEFMKNLTMSDLQLIKTPYGRAYMGIAQQYGGTIWGIS